jgi:hypothetical protein
MKTTKMRCDGAYTFLATSGTAYALEVRLIKKQKARDQLTMVILITLTMEF